MGRLYYREMNIIMPAMGCFVVEFPFIILILWLYDKVKLPISDKQEMKLLSGINRAARLGLLFFLLLMLSGIMLGVLQSCVGLSK